LTERGRRDNTPASRINRPGIR